jgi:predicted O-methyltransferase YrrM
MTIATPLELRTLTGELTMATWTLAAIAALLESGLVEHLREARSLEELAARCPTLPQGTIERCLGVASDAGVVSVDGQSFRLAPGALPFSEAPGRSALQGDLRSQLMQALALVDAAAAGNAAPGWTHTNPALLQAQGDASMAMVPLFQAKVVASLGDLSARLDRPGARFLDVGVGVASLAIAMCRCWPELHVVGLDTFEVPLGLARQNVARAGLVERISLRQLAVEQLQDEEVFDLAWLPSFFVAAPVLPEAVARVRAALRPGAWILFPISGIAGANRPRAVFGLISQLWGGPSLTSDEGETLLKGAGFTDIRVLVGPPSTPPLLVAQR